MKSENKNKIITYGFIIILIVIFLINIILKDKQVSTSERRKLAQFPKISIEKLVSGDAAKELEKYNTDQFVARDFFRGIKSFFSINIFKQKDNNGLFEKDGAIYKMEDKLNIKNVTKSADKINYVYEKYLKNMNVYYAIIPDKNYYLENDDHLKINYNELKQIMQNRLIKMQYIDIWNSLKLEDYYKTDLHWKQENLSQVVKTIQDNMNLEDTSKIDYIKHNLGDFYGTYYGQLALNIQPDKLCILTNDTIKNCTTYNYETEKIGKIYEEPNTSDKYDTYLSGATPLITIENPNAIDERELLLFRDSFGSSIAPLIVENYKKITLIDLRYISSNLLEQYIEFNNQDVLFLYSTLVLKQNVLK